MIKIAPSTNPEDEKNLINYVKVLQDANADYLHCDVMDGKFVDNSCLSSDLLYEVSQHSTIPLDVHLMVSNPIQVWQNYYKSKPTIITFHYESLTNKNNIYYLLSEIRKKKILAGLSINPDTNIDVILPYLPYLDLVLIMSVVPGKSGQKFIESTYDKISTLHNVITENNFNVRIEVDGGVNKDNVSKLNSLGVDIVVMGNSIYKENDKKTFIENIKKLTQQ